jgi:hypothetical protein
MGAIKIFSTKNLTSSNKMKQGIPFYIALVRAMSKRGLKTTDIIAFPGNQQQLDAIVQLIKEDLNYIEKVSKDVSDKKQGLQKKKD